MKPEQVLDLWKWARELAHFFYDEKNAERFRQVMTLCREYAEKSMQVEALAAGLGKQNTLAEWRTARDQMKAEQ